MKLLTAQEANMLRKNNILDFMDRHGIQQKIHDAAFEGKNSVDIKMDQDTRRWWEVIELLNSYGYCITNGSPTERTFNISWGKVYDECDIYNDFLNSLLKDMDEWK